MDPIIGPSALALAGVSGGALAEPVSHVDLGEFSRDMIGGLMRLHAEHGPIAAIQDGTQRVVFLFHPEYNRQVLSDTQRFHARFFAIRGPKCSAQRRLTCGLLAMNGEQHRRNRRLVKEPFSLRAISGYGEVIGRLTQELLADWQHGQVRDMGDDIRRYMLRVTSALLFGLKDPEFAYQVGDMIGQWVALTHRVGAGALVPDQMFTDHYEELLAYAERLEVEIRRMIEMKRADRSDGHDLLSILVRAHDEQGLINDEELVGQTSVIFSASHLTTAHSLSWTLFLLAQHPSVMGQLWQEIQSAGSACPFSQMGGACPDGSIGGDAGTLIERVLKESMRVLPASAYSQRINVEAVQLGPLSLPRGTGIVFTPLITHRLEEFYDRPQQFTPDRWLTIKPSPYEYHPFGAGPRLCVGGPLAMAILRTALPTILNHCRLEVVPGSEITARIESTMLTPATPIPVRIHPPDGQFASSPVGGNIHDLVDLVEAPIHTADEAAL